MPVATRSAGITGVIPAHPRPVVPVPAVPVAPAPPSLVEYGTRRFIIVAGVMLASLLQTADLTIVNVALPTIQGNLGASVDEGTWVLTAYVIANVIVIPMTPWLQLRFGRKNYFLVSIAGFTVASMLCGVANSLDALILFRALQGAFGGGLLATAQIVLRDTLPAERLGVSQSIFALGTILGPSAGPTLGGMLVDNLSWQWVFDVNLVPGVLAFVLLWRYLRDNSQPQQARVDVTGIALLVVAVGCMQYVLDQGQRLQFHQTMLAAQITLARLPVAQFLQQSDPAALAATVAAQSAALAYADAFLVAGIFALVVSPVVLLLARKKA